MHMVRKKLKHLKRRKVNEELRTIYAMIQLLKKSDEFVSYLQKIRINPKLQVSSQQRTKMRADLEFYLPQIVAHYLREDLDGHQET